MKKVGKTSSGKILVEMSLKEWTELVKRKLVPIDLAVALREYRFKHGLTQFELAEKLGIGRATLQTIEGGLVKNIKLQTYERIISVVS